MPPSEPLVLMDIAHAQRLFELSGEIDRVDLILTDDSGFPLPVESGLPPPVRHGSGRRP